MYNPAVRTEILGRELTVVIGGGPHHMTIPYAAPMYIQTKVHANTDGVSHYTN